MPRTLAPATAAALACALGLGCVPSLNGNDPRDVRKKTPESFAATDTSATSTPPGPAITETWTELFRSTELRSLVDAALVNNQELNIQLQEIIIAENEVSARRGEVLPRVGANVGAGIEKTPRYTSQGASDTATGLPEHLGNFAFGLSGSWEVDVWKKLRDAAKSAAFRYLASVEGRNFMVTQIVAEIARSYYELVALDNQLDVLRRNIDVQAKALEVVKLEKLAARVTELAVQRFEAEVLKNRSHLYDVEQERVQTENRINFLVGRYPQPVRRDAEELKTPPVVGAAPLPARLLDQRPDLRQAELELEAAKLDVKVARAAFYPSLSIDASIGYRSFNAEHLVTTPESLLYGVAGNLTAPLLNRAAITAQYRTANAKQLQAVFHYEKTLLQAFTDVVNQLATLENLRRAADLQAQQVDKLAQSVEIAGVLFQSARADYMEVLLTRRDSLESELTLIETKKRQFQALVGLYQALGGGWGPEGGRDRSRQP